MTIPVKLQLAYEDAFYVRSEARVPIRVCETAENEFLGVLTITYEKLLIGISTNVYSMIKQHAVDIVYLVGANNHINWNNE